MRARQHRPVAAVLVAVAMLAVAGCSGDDDDSSANTSESSTTTSEAGGPTTLAQGEDVELVGDDGGLTSQTLNVSAEEEDGVVTGEFRVTENVITLECADTDTDGVVILGGAATAGPDVAVGDLLALIIREGDPDSVALYANVRGAESCTELLESLPAAAQSDFVDVEDGYDIETG